MGRIGVLLVCLSGWLGGSLSGIARAAEPEPARAGRHLGVEGLTDFPLHIGGQVWAEFPGRIRLTTSFGELPDIYLDTINAVAVKAGAYNHATADLISEALDRAFTWRIQAGWRPFKRRGAYFEAGFGILEVDAALAVASVVRAASSFPVPQELNVGFGYELHTLVETVGGEVGWMWYPWRSLTVRVALGFHAAVAAQVHLEPNFASTLQRPFTRFAAAYVEEIIERNLFIPTVGLAIGWRLF
jgi:hypothetical protein